MRQGGNQKDFSTAIMDRKKVLNRLIVDETVIDDNPFMLLKMETMEKLQLFRGYYYLHQGNT